MAKACNEPTLTASARTLAAAPVKIVLNNSSFTMNLQFVPGSEVMLIFLRCADTTTDAVLRTEFARKVRPSPGRRASLRERNQNRSEEHTTELQSRQYLVCR